MDKIQNNTSIDKNITSNAVPTKHVINLTESDAEYVKNYSTSIQTYWFVDCHFMEKTDNLTFVKKYSKANEEHVVDAVVVVGYDPITTIAPPTTTVSPNVTTVKPNTTTTTKKPVANAIKVNEKLVKHRKRSLVAQQSKENVGFHGCPSKCNNTIVPRNQNYTYGCFKTKVQVRGIV